MTASSRPTDAVVEAAVDWFIRVRSTETGEQEHAGWLAWIESDPMHRIAFEEVQEAWTTSGAVRSPPWPRPEELASDGRTPGWGWRPVALAASVLVAVTLATAAVVAGKFSTLGGERIATERGEQQSAMLSDGSRIELGGLTGVEVSYTDERRLIVADEGEAFYKVARDGRRPFVVQAGPVDITALGTAFSVRREGDSVSVVVSEGVVEVKPRDAGSDEAGAAIRAKAGERVRFSAGKLVPRVEPLQTDIAASWRRGRLRFEDEPLQVVVASLNRYSRREIVLADPQLAQLRFTGTVFDDRVEDWLGAVQKVFPVAVKELKTGQIVVQRRFPE